MADDKPDDHLEYQAKLDGGGECTMHVRNVRYGQAPTSMLMCVPYGDGTVMAIIAGSASNLIAFSRQVVLLGGLRTRVLLGILATRAGEAEPFSAASLGVWPEGRADDLTGSISKVEDHPHSWAAHYVETMIQDGDREAGPDFLTKNDVELVRHLFDQQCAAIAN